MVGEIVFRLIKGDFFLFCFNYIQIDFLFRNISFNYILHYFLIVTNLVIFIPDVHGLVVSQLICIHSFTCIKINQNQ
jgi:hypothetical protein